MTNQYNISQRQAITEYRNAHKLGNNVSDAQVVKHMQSSGKLPKAFQSLANQKKTSGKPNSVMTSKSKNVQNNQSQLKSLGYKDSKGAGSKIKAKNGKTYTVVGSATNGRKIVKDAGGNYQVLSHDGVLLNKDYVKKQGKFAPKNTSTSSYKAAVSNLTKNLNTAKKNFQAQLEDDGWAGDVADGISVLWGSKNRASVVRKDIKAEENRIKQLANASKSGDKAFRAKFKQIYGIDYNQAAVDRYNKNPTLANYQKAFGTKVQNIGQRVLEYNESQKVGAEVVKTTAKVAAGVAVGVATGGTALVAIGTAAAATTVSSVLIEESDRYKITSGGGFRKGTNHKKIIKGAIVDGVSTLATGGIGAAAGKAIQGTTKIAMAGRTLANVTGDVAVGAAQEYVETGKITKEGTLLNAAGSSVGNLAGSGAFKSVKDRLVKNFKTKRIKNVNAQKNIASSSNVTNKSNAATTQNVEIASNNVNNSTNTKHLDIKENVLDFNENIDPDLAIAGGSGDGFFSKVKNMFKSSSPSANIAKTIDVPSGRYVSIDNTNMQISNTSMGCVVSVNGKVKPYKVNAGESKVIGKNFKGEDVVLNRDLNGNYKVSIGTEVTTPTVNSSTLRRPNTNNQFVNRMADRPISSTPTSNLATSKDVPFGKYVSIDDNMQITNTAHGCMLKNNGERVIYELDLGESKVIGKNANGQDIILRRNSEKSYVVEYSKSSSNVASRPSRNIASEQNISQKTVSKSTSAPHSAQVSSRYSEASLSELRKTDPTQYNLIAQKELSSLRQTNPSTYRLLEKSGVMDAISNPTRRATISERTLHAIHLENQGKTLVSDLSDDIDISQISKHVENGGVCNYKDKLYVNDNGTPVELSISKEKFEELFPPVESSIIRQPMQSEDCWFLSSLAGEMETPKGRVELYKRFRQDGDDIYVQIGSKNNFPEIKFPNGKFERAHTQVQSSKGIQMIEIATAVHRTRPRAYGGSIAQGKKLYEKGVDFVDVASISSDPDVLIGRLGYGHQESALNTYLGPFESNNLNYKMTKSKEEFRQQAKDFIINNANNSDTAVLIGTDGTGKVSSWNLNLGHGTRVIGYDNGIVQFVDQLLPGGTGVYQEIPIDVLVEHLGSINTTQFRPKISLTNPSGRSLNENIPKPQMPKSRTI